MGLAAELLKADKEKGGGSDDSGPRPSSLAIKDLYRALKTDDLSEEQFERKFRASIKAMTADE